MRVTQALFFRADHGKHIVNATGENVNSSHVFNGCGKFNLNQSASLVKQSDFVFTHDTGLMHIAAALDRPLLALYGSSSPRFTPPLSEKAQILKLDMKCSPCFKRECPLGHLDCLNKLTPESVLTHCRQWIAP